MIESTPRRDPLTQFSKPSFSVPSFAKPSFAGPFDKVPSAKKVPFVKEQEIPTEDTLPEEDYLFQLTNEDVQVDASSYYIEQLVPERPSSTYSASSTSSSSRPSSSIPAPERAPRTYYNKLADSPSSSKSDTSNQGAHKLVGWLIFMLIFSGLRFCDSKPSQPKKSAPRTEQVQRTQKPAAPAVKKNPSAPVNRTIDFANGDRYTGPVVNGRPHGYGVYRWKNGTTYEGPFVKGSMKGQGVIRYYNGSVYRGEVFNARPHGMGVCTSSRGTVQRGRWENGKLVEVKKSSKR